jgi:RNA polymerase sigma factor (sigma-70 family)
LRTVPLKAERPRLGASRRLLRLAGDDRLVEEIRRGNEAALEAAYDRHGAGILSFCRHMLGSPEEAEEAVQHSFAAAWADLQRNERPMRLKPWLYAIARNRCLSLLRARRPDALELHEGAVATAGLSEEVGRRAELRELLADLRELPEEQRAALVLTELEGLSHADVAEALGRKDKDVKALVFRARSSLAESRKARDTSCDEVREQLSVLRGGSLRRSWLRGHLKHCEGCREFREQVRDQRRMLALVLPVVPSLGLKTSVFAAAGLGGGSAGGGAAAAGVGATALSTVGAKVALVAVVAGGAVGASEIVRDDPRSAPSERRAPHAQPGVAAPGGSADGARSPGSASAPNAARENGRRRAAARRDAGRLGNQRGKAPVDTPVKAKGSPPAVGRVRRGLAPPQGGPKPGRGQARRGAGGKPPPKEKPVTKVKAKPVPPVPRVRTDRLPAAPTEQTAETP